MDTIGQPQRDNVFQTCLRILHSNQFATLEVQVSVYF